MVVGDQQQQAMSAGLDQSQIADVINRQKIGDPRLRREMMRMGTSDPNAFALQNKETLQQAQQPSEFIGAGGRTYNFQQGQQVSPQTLEGYFGNLRKDVGLDVNPYEYTYTTNKVQVPNAGVVDDVSSFLSGGASAEPQYQETKTINLPEYAKIYSPITYDQATEGSLGTIFNQKPQLDVVNELLKGNAVDWEQYAQQVNQANEIIPNNPAYSQLKEQFDPLYTSKPVRQIMESLGSMYGMSEAELNQIAGTVAADMVRESQVSGKAPWTFGGENITQRYTDAFNKYLGYKYGTKLSPDTYNKVLSAGSDIANKFTQARDIESHSGGFFSDVLPALSMIAKFTPAAPFAYAYDAINALDNGNILGAGLAALGGYNSFTGGEFMGGVNDTIGSSLGVSPDIAKLISSSTLGGLGSVAAGGQFLPGAVGGGVGGYLGDMFGGQFRDIGEVGSKAIGGATSGLLNSLFTKNDPIAGSLFGGMSGGLHGYLNTVGRDLGPVSPQEDNRNRQFATNTMKLAKLFRGK